MAYEFQSLSGYRAKPKMKCKSIAANWGLQNVPLELFVGAWPIEVRYDFGSTRQIGQRQKQCFGFAEYQRTRPGHSLTLSANHTKPRQANHSATAIP